MYNDEIYLLLDKTNQVRVHDLNGDVIRTWEHEGGFKGENKLRVTGLGVVIPSAPKRALSIYDFNGLHIRDISCPSIYNSCISLTLNGDKSVIVSSCPSSKIEPYVFNVNIESGEVVWTCGLSEPRGVVCYKDFVLVANYGYYGYEIDVLQLDDG